MQGAVTVPIVGQRIKNHSTQGLGTVITGAAGGFTVVAISDDCPGIGIEQQFGTIEAHPELYAGLTVDPVAIDLTGFQAMNEDMPIIEGTIDLRIKQDDAGRRRISRLIKQQQFNGLAVFGEDTEIDTV